MAAVDLPVVSAAAPRHWRLIILFATVCLCAAGLVGRLVYWQVMQSAPLQKRVSAQHLLDETVSARRGSILDTNGDLLAGNLSVDYIYAEPARIKDPQEVANKLAPVLGVTPEQLLPALSDRQRTVVPLLNRRKFPSNISEQVAKLRIPGIFLEPTTSRVYPENQLAAHLLGFVDGDSKGWYGIEGLHQETIGGRPGRLRAEKDTAGNEIAFSVRNWQPPEDGLNVKLTIDRTIQYIAERELDRAVVQHQASGGTVIVMEPSTGAILAMASRPAFDPNRYPEFAARPEVFANPAVTFQYEPGSTFKLITVAAAVNERVVTPHTTFMDNGALSVGGYVIHNWDGKANGLSTIVQLLEKSSNIGASWVAFQTGKERFYRYVTAFGFGQPTGIDLQGEASGLVKDYTSKDWGEIDLVTNSYGQAISVTPIQMITAVAAIANGGILMKPHVVKEVLDPHTDKVVHRTQPQIARQVINRDTAATMLQMMINAAENGETRGALVPGYHVGGKTGTASIPVNGAYDPTQTIASFVGVVPASDPKFVVLVKIDRPQDEPWGSLIAKPAFAIIAQELTRYLKVPAEYEVPPTPPRPTASPTQIPRPSQNALNPATNRSGNTNARPTPAPTPARRR
ncbi:MAG TPA: penicillin-binding protein 2 [Chloroflexota bacterium]|nr:penicillin-binding protein 2 [Chloroflexota bacterium]